MAKRILHIDSDEAVRKLVIRNLKALGFKIDSANTLDFFERRLAEGNIDLVIIGDLSRDRSHNRNFDLLDQIKRDSSTADIPVIILSQRDGGYDVESAVNAGADNYLIKPFQPMVLFAAISRIFNPQESDEEGGVDA